MSHKVKIVEVELAVDASRPPSEIADGLSSILSGAIYADNSVLLDWQYTGQHAGDNPQEGDVFAANQHLDMRARAAREFSSAYASVASLAVAPVNTEAASERQGKVRMLCAIFPELRSLGMLYLITTVDRPWMVYDGDTHWRFNNLYHAMNKLESSALKRLNTGGI
jgi:hypothetical protein